MDGSVLMQPPIGLVGACTLAGYSRLCRPALQGFVDGRADAASSSILYRCTSIPKC